jgi:hypothetical protein
MPSPTAELGARGAVRIQRGGARGLRAFGCDFETAAGFYLLLGVTMLCYRSAAVGRRGEARRGVARGNHMLG